eukprot:COSAG02_NODE_4624_length_5152_cov_23.466653_5_plen_114_part_00
MAHAHHHGYGDASRRLAAVLGGMQQRCGVNDDASVVLLHRAAGLASTAEQSSRVSSWPLGDPIVYDGVLSGEDQPGVSPEEAVFFKEHGFLVKVSLSLHSALRTTHTPYSESE